MAKDFKNLFVNFIQDRELKRCASLYLTGRLIDIGCGTRPYKNLLAPYSTKHIGVDYQNALHDNSNIERFGTAYDIPAENGKVDCTLCTTALKHLEEPKKDLHECHCIIKRRGVAIYSVPFIWHLHVVSRDFYRFSN